MADLFLKEDVLKLLVGKFILMLGDSNIRSFYKDLLHLYIKNDIAPSDFFRTSNQDSFLGDQILRMSNKTQGRDVFEEREFKDDFVHIRFHFITKAYGKSMKTTLGLIENGSIPMPNIIVMNSCVWDLTRWGPKQEDNYKKDLISLFGKIKKITPEDTLTIWCSTLPVAVQQCKGGILIKQLEFVKHSLRFMVLEANKFTQQLCIAFGIDFLDLHYHMRYQLHRRAIDGIHWETHAIRMILCLILTHIGLSFEISLPGYMAKEGINYVRDAYNEASEVIYPPPLKEIGFQKDIEEEIKRELEECKGAEKIDKHKMKERVIKNARRRGNITEDNVPSFKQQSSRSGKFSPIRFPEENKPVKLPSSNGDSEKGVTKTKSSSTGFKLKGKGVKSSGNKVCNSLSNDGRGTSYLEFERNSAADRKLNEGKSFSPGAFNLPFNKNLCKPYQNLASSTLAQQSFPNNFPNFNFTRKGNSSFGPVGLFGNRSNNSLVTNSDLIGGRPGRIPSLFSFSLPILNFNHGNLQSGFSSSGPFSNFNQAPYFNSYGQQNLSFGHHQPK